MTTWVFGASGNIGRRVCEGLLQRGDKVIAFTSTIHSAEVLSKELQDFGEIITHGVDLLDTEVSKKIIALTRDTKPEHVIYLARGTVALDSCSEDENYDTIFSEDFFLALLFPIKLSLLLGKHHSESLRTITIATSQYGLIAQDSSIYESPNENISTAYCSIRAGVNLAVKSLAAQLGTINIRVNAIALGGYGDATPANLRAEISRKLPEGVMLTAADIQGVFNFLSSEASSGITGSTIVADKGWTAR